MRRLAAIAGLALVASLAAPASAHQTGDHDLQFAPDAPPEGTEMSETDFVTAFADLADGILRWRVEFRADTGGEPFACDGNDVQAGITFHKIQCDWDTARSGTFTYRAYRDGSGTPKQEKTAEQLGGRSANGAYTVTVSVWNRGKPAVTGLFSSPAVPSEEHKITRRVFVKNDVSTPTGAARSFDSGSRTVNVTWAANSEPDIEKYVIEERIGDGAWTAVGERGGSSTSFSRQLPDPGAYHYRVVAHRSGFHAASPPAPVLDVAASTGPTTAAPSEDPRGDDGPEPGLFNPGEPEPTTTTGSATTSSTPGSARGGLGGGAGGSLFPRPSSTPRPGSSTPRLTTPTTADTGYTETLPYAVPEPDSGGEELAQGPEPKTFTRIITVPSPRDPRALLVPLAGGLTVFVFAMQITYVLRRRPGLANAENDFGDWVGY